MKRTYVEILSKIKQAKTIALFTHSSPDPDAIGSILTFYEIIKQLGKEADMFCGDKPDKFLFLPNYEKLNPELKEYDLLITLDTGGPSQLDDYEQYFLSHENTIRIDHHENGKAFAKLNLMVPESSCTVLIFDIIKLFKLKVTPLMATYMYFGICGDTGVFKFSNTDSKTFEVSAKLLKFGADIKKVYDEYFEKTSVSRIKLVANIMLNSKINDEVGYVILKVKLKDYEKYGATIDENLSNLPNEFLNCGYKFAAILKEREDKISCSFRSKNRYDCSIVASKFGGGGHTYAAACSFQESIESVEKKLEKEIIKYIKGEDEKC